MHPPVTPFSVPVDLIAAFAVIITSILMLACRVPLPPPRVPPEPLEGELAAHTARNRRVLRSFGFVWIPMAALVSGAFALMGLMSIYRNTCAQTWPTVEGAVIDSKVEARTGGGEDGSVVSYWPQIRYAYLVRGTRYESDRIYPSGAVNIESGNTWSDANRTLQSLIQSKPFLVHFNPRDPGDSTLETSPQSGFTPFIVGVGFLLFGVVGIGGGLLGSLWNSDETTGRFTAAWVVRSTAMGLALVVVGFASLTMMMGVLPAGPGWWGLSIAAIPLSQILLAKSRRPGDPGPPNQINDAGANDDLNQADRGEGPCEKTLLRP
jgi:hypothetical protein